MSHPQTWYKLNGLKDQLIVKRSASEQELTVSLEELLGLGEEKNSSNGVPFTYINPYSDARLRDVTFYLHDHLGNTRVTYTASCTTSGGNERVLALEHAADYFPYGSILREFVNGQQEKYLTTHHERDVETGLDYRGARYYDSDVARFLSLDPAQAEYAAWNPYQYVMGNPISLTDPTGKRVDKYSVDDDGNVNFMEKKDGPDELYKVDASCSVESMTFVNDKSILPQLAGGSVACTSNGQQALDVFHFMATNTDVEWGVRGYEGGGFSLFTDHSPDGVKPPDGLGATLFSLHNHPREGGNPEPSGRPYPDPKFYKEQSDYTAAMWDGTRNPHQRNFMYHPTNGSMTEYNMLGPRKYYSSAASQRIQTFLPY